MRAALIDALGQALMNNLGNRITPELATGIATAVNQVGLQIEAEQLLTAGNAAADPPAQATGE